MLFGRQQGRITVGVTRWWAGRDEADLTELACERSLLLFGG
ncbi:hypothetical protein ACFLUA_02665 [Chloroflexota bacterium]